jgi:hypothetical protein
MDTLSLSVYQIPGGGYGYQVILNGITIDQETLPSTEGVYLMTSPQATILGTTVEKKIKNKLQPSLTKTQVSDLIEGKKTPTQIVNEELGI